ncbi:MAG: hypothetical protein HOK30_12230 [Rhodospirillaceae bacterium]|nr:hypothetical protein [Rhodospirillaceae bacterium]
MARGMVIGGASIGLSALLAALLLTTVPAERRGVEPSPDPVPQKTPVKAPVENPHPRAVILPPPPRTAAPPPRPPLQPKEKPEVAATEIKPLEPTQPRTAKRQPPPSPIPIKPTKPVPVKIETRPAQTTKPTPASRPATDVKAVAAQGRVLLHLLEHGQGPAIELAWPGNADQRARLYHKFRDCFGMQVALARHGGELFIAGSPRGQSWQPNRDRYSGFARQPSGRLVAAERDDLHAIARRHGLPRDIPAMRIFPRRVDARLLGGLDQLLAGGYGKAASIRARHQLSGGRIIVRDIQVDGRAVPGMFDLGNRCGRV